MTDKAFRIVFTGEEQAHNFLLHHIIPFYRETWKKKQRVVGTLDTEEDQRSKQQNSYLWGVVLKEISEQARINGIGATPDGWHLYFKRRVLGYKFKKTTLPGKKRPSVVKELRSTADLSVKQMSAYLEEVFAISVTEFGVGFSVTRWQDHQQH